MKIAIIGANQKDSMEWHIADAFLYAGHNAKIFDIYDKFPYTVKRIKPYFLAFDKTLRTYCDKYERCGIRMEDFISPNDITFVTIPYANFVVEQEVGSVEVVLPTVHSDNEEDGKVSFLLLLGSVLILLGVIVSIIMLYQ